MKKETPLLLPIAITFHDSHLPHYTYSKKHPRLTEIHPQEQFLNFGNPAENLPFKIRRNGKLYGKA
ncbi:MAG: hypothetical protein I8H66_06980 [Sphingobacteriia bacterium]|nr:hypothetical protein [Sphingobacteriia bacterium]